ncbi:hypothetical protein KGO95_03890 [Patescibacteria group bacterium]|nr:hypothetical protein [Patescibacteria group bacterium]
METAPDKMKLATKMKVYRVIAWMINCAFFSGILAFLYMVRKDLGIDPFRLAIGMVASYIGIYLFEQIAFMLKFPRKSLPASVIRVSMFLAGVFYGWHIPDPSAGAMIIVVALVVFDLFHRSHFT